MYLDMNAFQYTYTASIVSLFVMSVWFIIMQCFRVIICISNFHVHAYSASEEKMETHKSLLFCWNYNDLSNKITLLQN